jgi:hypothetical protein
LEFRKIVLFLWYQKQSNMNNTYGVLNAEGIHTDVSKTERGAKQYATLHGYTRVSIRYNGGMTVVCISEKKGNRWYNVKDY